MKMNLWILGRICRIFLHQCASSDQISDDSMLQHRRLVKCSLDMLLVIRPVYSHTICIYELHSCCVLLINYVSYLS